MAETVSRNVRKHMETRNANHSYLMVVGLQHIPGLLEEFGQLGFRTHAQLNR